MIQPRRRKVDQLPLLDSPDKENEKPKILPLNQENSKSDLPKGSFKFNLNLPSKQKQKVRFSPQVEEK
jgi:hypothetical protein